MDDKAYRTLHTALNATRDGRAVWEVFDFYEDGEEIIRAAFDRVILRISEKPPGYHLVVHEPRFQELNEYDLTPDSPGFDLLDAVYKAGRAVARDASVVAEERIQRLERGLKAGWAD